MTSGRRAVTRDSYLSASMDAKLFQPFSSLPKTAPTLFFPPAIVRELVNSPLFIEEARRADLCRHDPPRTTLEGFVNRPDW